MFNYQTVKHYISILLKHFLIDLVYYLINIYFDFREGFTAFYFTFLILIINFLKKY